MKRDESIPSSLARSTIWNARGRKRKRGSDPGKHRIWSQNLNFETHPHPGYFFTDSNMSQIALQLKETLRYCLATAELIMAFIILVFSERFRVYQTMHEYAITEESICELIAITRNHASKSKKPALRLVSIVSEEQPWLHIDSFLFRTYIFAPIVADDLDGAAQRQKHVRISFQKQKMKNI